MCAPFRPHADIKLRAADTNNLLALLTKLYPDAEVLSKVVVIKHDHYTW